jgi:hypothetical protein
MFSAPVSVEPSRGCDNGRTVQVGPGSQVSDYPTNRGLPSCSAHDGSPDRGAVTENAERLIHAAEPPWDRRAWRGARAGKLQSNRPRSLLQPQRQSEEGW